MNTSTDNFSITLQPSRALFISLCSVHFLAIVSILFLSIPIFVKVALVFFVFVLATYTVNQYVLLKSEKSIYKLNCRNTRKCRVELNNGKVYQANLIAANWLFDYFAVLVLQNNTKKFKATIAKDTMSQEQFYALRLYLRSLNK